MRTETEVEAFITKHRACAEGAAFARQYATLSEVYDNCERGDWMTWMLARAGKLNKRQTVEIAVKCAMRVLKHYEAKNPDDKRPRKALEDARAWLRNKNDETRAAAADADAAAATYAAAAATYAAYAAAADADAYADAAARQAATLKERKAQCKIIRQVVPNPWRVQ